ncbi:hypothetical protein GZ77_00235 [Endozoicomonas montiporae]|uniref:Uncharacterized protein n=2 Tax=Endozoicomonas montiporae TaxID=1027273 RepID=A0A081N9P4_9GAMM|nr:hypothetical protein [Endozoicomonas montiporae]AMO55021.1 hypothetical protein EZMO1_0796 [Endozoicomonas montiporae CL-33]KEQ15167.1 hypothetical protein GZ77_00235 [Endozoicomonas montiporae]
MGNDIRGTGRKTAPPPYSDPRTPQPDTGKAFKQWKVRLSPGKRFIRWCKEAAFRWIPGMRLVDRVVSGSLTLINTTARPPGRGEYWEKVPLTRNLSEKREIAIDSALSQLPYWMNWEDVSEAERLHGGDDAVITSLSGDKSSSGLQPLNEIHIDFFKQITPLLADVPAAGSAPVLSTIQKAHPLLKTMRLSSEGILFAPRTGLTATLTRNNQNNSLTLAFGGTKSGSDIRLFEQQAGEIRRKRFNLTWGQIKADIRNFVGWSVPTIYRQAAELAGVIQGMAEREKMPLSLTGHSLGGGLAAYSAAKHGLKARTFSPAALGKKTLADLSQSQKTNANELIHNYLVTDDPVNNHWLSNPFRMMAKPTIIGKRSVIEEQPQTGENTMIGRHIWSHRHYMEVLKKDR